MDEKELRKHRCCFTGHRPEKLAVPERQLEYLWDNQVYIDDNALSVNINRIREKLVSIGLTDFIKTKHRQGYTL